MPLILALDSSTEACSVALYDGTELVEDFQLLPREHTKRMLPMVQQLLADRCQLKELDAIAFGRGPGSFTGLRICLGLVQGLAFGAELPVVPVSSLAALAQKSADQHPECERLLPLLDARMDEVYWGEYRRGDDGLVISVQSDQLSSPEQVTVSNPATVRADGPGLIYAERLSGASGMVMGDIEQLPGAGEIARLGYRDFMSGAGVDADQALPLYLRDNVAWQN